MIAVSCSSGSDGTTSSVDSEAPADSAATTDGSAADAPVVDSSVDDTSGSAVEPVPTEGSSGDPTSEEGFESLGPPTGEPILIGMVNTEGTPGLDFPEMRTDTDLAADYLNEHGGLGGRPVQIEHCAAAGSPETSQACAQELSGKGVEMVMLGLDLFPGYDTFAASDTPVFGALPVLPSDFTADALFLTGGNATTMAAMVGLAVEHLDASTVGIISADNPGANGSEASLTASLDKAGVEYVSVKGGDNETDAGFQGLIREANSDNPDALISLYSDGGCIGAMRGRVSLGIDTPMISTAICGSADVIDVVGDDAVGWYFAGVGEPVESPTTEAFNAIIEPAYGPDAAVSLGVGAIGITQIMSLARVANRIAEEGGEVTGSSIYERLGTSNDILNFPNDSPLECGASPTYPSICNFEFPVGEYVAGGKIVTVPGFESFNVVAYLP